MHLIVSAERLRPVPKFYSLVLFLVSMSMWVLLIARIWFCFLFSSLKDNHTWDIVPCPVGVKLLGCIWVYTTKLRADDSIERHKARLVALGNRQEYGLDYEETFVPVAKMTTLQTIMAIAVSKG